MFPPGLLFYFLGHGITSSAQGAKWRDVEFGSPHWGEFFGCFYGIMALSNMEIKNGDLVEIQSGWWWLEPWNFEWLSIQLGMSSSQLTFTHSIIFQRGRSTNHQPAMDLMEIMLQAVMGKLQPYYSQKGGASSIPHQWIMGDFSLARYRTNTIYIHIYIYTLW